MSPHSPAAQHRNTVTSPATLGITGSESEKEWVKEVKQKCKEEEVKTQEGAAQRLACVGGTPSMQIL